MPVLQGVRMSAAQRPTSAEERERMSVIPYAFTIGSISMPCCVPDLLYTLPPSLAREYNSDLGVDHWTAVIIILSGIRICFSIMEVTQGSS